MKTQTIIVTSASSGIGKEIAHHFLANGDNVVVNSSTAEKLERPNLRQQPPFCPVH